MRNARGWRTLGDVGHLDQDGYLYLTDRAADMVVSGGVNIYPREAEQVLATHPRVADAAVFGIPDEEMGEALMAVVQPDDGHPPPDASELLAWCRDRLAPSPSAPGASSSSRPCPGTRAASCSSGGYAIRTGRADSRIV